MVDQPQENRLPKIYRCQKLDKKILFCCILTAPVVPLPFQRAHGAFMVLEWNNKITFLWYFAQKFRNFLAAEKFLRKKWFMFLRPFISKKALTRFHSFLYLINWASYDCIIYVNWSHGGGGRPSCIKIDYSNLKAEWSPNRCFGHEDTYPFSTLMLKRGSMY